MYSFDCIVIRVLLFCCFLFKAATTHFYSININENFILRIIFQSLSNI